MTQIEWKQAAEQERTPVPKAVIFFGVYSVPITPWPSWPLFELPKETAVVSFSVHIV
jgi:hypothetical protein